MRPIRVFVRNIYSKGRPECKHIGNLAAITQQSVISVDNYLKLLEATSSNHKVNIIRTSTSDGKKQNTFCFTFLIAMIRDSVVFSPGFDLGVVDLRDLKKSFFLWARKERVSYMFCIRMIYMYTTLVYIYIPVKTKNNDDLPNEQAQKPYDTPIVYYVLNNTRTLHTTETAFEMIHLVSNPKKLRRNHTRKQLSKRVPLQKISSILPCLVSNDAKELSGLEKKIFTNIEELNNKV